MGTLEATSWQDLVQLCKKCLIVGTLCGSYVRLFGLFGLRFNEVQQEKGTAVMLPGLYASVFVLFNDPFNLH